MKISGGKWSNWSGGVRCKPRRIVAPADEAALAIAVREAEGTIRAPGTGHSFTPLCATDGTLIDLSALRGLISVDRDAQTATFAAATPLWAIGPALYEHGYALANMGDIDRQTLGGVVGTGTHGTGRSLTSLSAQVAGFRLVTAGGEILDCSRTRNAEIFEAGRVSFGSLGIMTEITMHVLPAYKLVERNFSLTTDELFAQLDTLVASNRHFEFFWFPYADTTVCKSLNPTDAEAPEPRTAEEMFKRGETSSSADMRAFAGINEVLPYTPFLLKRAHALFSQLMPGPDRVRWSYEIFPSPRNVRFNEMEYALPFADGPACLKELVDTIRGQRINTGFPIEYRTVKGDDVWLSPFCGRDSVTIAVHQYHRVDTRRLFSACEAIFRKYGGRPHWGKRHTRNAKELAEIYPDYTRFAALRQRLDPLGRFLNPHLRTLFG